MTGTPKFAAATKLVEEFCFQSVLEISRRVAKLRSTGTPSVYCGTKLLGGFYFRSVALIT